MLHVGLDCGIGELSPDESLGVEDGVWRVHGHLLIYHSQKSITQFLRFCNFVAKDIKKHSANSKLKVLWSCRKALVILKQCSYLRYKYFRNYGTKFRREQKIGLLKNSFETQMSFLQKMVKNLRKSYEIAQDLSENCTWFLAASPMRRSVSVNAT